MRPVHLVGSVNLEDTHEVFREAARVLGERLRRLPDGETGDRAGWSGRLGQQLLDHPAFENAGTGAYGIYSGMRFAQLSDSGRASTLVVDPPGYGEYAEESYALFRERRAAGELPESLRFLVALPTPHAWLSYVAHEHRALVEPALERAILDDLKKVCASIPAEELAIQWDVCNEIASLEGLDPVHYDSPLDGLATRLATLVDAVPPDVEVGLHFCYGSYGDVHFMEPADAGVMVQFANAVVERASRKIHYLHFPVPRERSDDAYFVPFDALAKKDETEIYLGLVHLEDGVEGAIPRIQAAGRHLSSFGVAAECGMARSRRDDTLPLLRLHAQVADAAVS